MILATPYVQGWHDGFAAGGESALRHASRRLGPETWAVLLNELTEYYRRDVPPSRDRAI